MRLMTAVIVLMTVSVLSLTILTPAGAQLTGKSDQLQTSLN